MPAAIPADKLAVEATMASGNPLRKLVKVYRILQNLVQSHRLRHYSEQEKRHYLASWAEATGCQVFVETGTYNGKTARFMSSRCRNCYTIEHSRDLYLEAKALCAGHDNVELFHGDSAEVLPTVLAKISEPALFWLDAHYSSGRTAGETGRAPIFAELGAIFAHHITDHAILIDDAREFMGMNGYPTIKQLRRFVRKNGRDYGMMINNDIIVLYNSEL